MVSDAGLDDAFALATLIGSGIAIRAVVATAGNYDLPHAVDVLAVLLAVLAPHVPIVRGATTGLEAPYPTPAKRFYDTGRLQGVGAHVAPVPLADDLLGGTVLAGAPLTCVASAMRAGASPRLVWMGGAVEGRGNITPEAEFNAWMDPEAVDGAMGDAGAFSMVPLEVTTRVALHPADIGALRHGGRTARLLADLADDLAARDGRFVPHDAVAALALIEPTLFRWERHALRCDTTDGPARGRTTVVEDGRDEGRPRVLLAREVDPAVAVRLVIEAVLRCP